MSQTLEPTTACIDLSLEDYLHRRVPACFPTGQRVVDIREMAAGVWAVGLGDGSHVVAKHQAFAAATAGRPDDLLIVEPQVLGLLAESGCPVPRAWSVDAETGFIFLEFCGAHTIDDIAQESGVSRDLSARLVTGFCQIERVLSQRQNELLPLVSSAATRQLLHEAATRTHAETREGLATILIHCQPLGVGSGGLETHLDDICRRLSQREPTLASTDFNARNVVVDARAAVTFIEFAKIGWDWPERRLVQYATSLGAGRKLGEFRSALDPQSIEQYDHCTDDGAFALDGHHILFHLQAAASLCRALERPAQPRHKALLGAWQRPRRRLRYLVGALATPFSDDTATSDFRSLFAKSVHPFIDGEQP